MSCKIIDKSMYPSDKSKALAIQARTLEIFHQTGMIDDFLNEGLILKAANPTSNQKRIGHISFEHIDSIYPFVLSLEQSKTEKILTKQLNKLGGKIDRD